ncbi:MAG: DUF1257 domain-containing protein [Planctomycetia bacterium]|nr:DUF1257 domain-containing protein [Planctomycetia bacterium]
MSHIVTISARLTNHTAVVAACRRLHLPEPRHGTAQLYSGEATGLLVQLPGWRYPAVIDTASGQIACDTFDGAWGEERELHRFLQAYAVEAVRLQARQRGLPVTEQHLADGSIKLSIQES